MAKSRQAWIRTPHSSAELPLVIASWLDNSRELTTEKEFVGSKAAGLLQLPQEWVPIFVVLTAGFWDLARTCGSVATALDKLPDIERRHFQELRAFAEQNAGKILVRSNAPDEDLADRGTYRSYTVSPNVETIAEAVTNIFGSSGKIMCIVLQSAVEPGLQGHMSNERRVSSKPSRWLVEGLFGRGLEPEQRFISANGVRTPSGRLHARNEKELIEQLRTVAAVLLRTRAGQYHCEWVWDGRRLWIVQCDDASSDESESILYANEYLTSQEHTPTIYEPQRPFLAFEETSDVWSKLERPKTFKRLGLPTANICFLSGTDWVDSDPVKHARILDELARICDQPTVIRCDVMKSAQADELLLATSIASTNPNDLSCFMNKQSRDFVAKGMAAEQWSFLPARLVPARASALVHAFPGAQYVRVDALWGYPDGLSHYSHDTFFYYPEDHRVVSHARYKGQCRLPVGNRWVTLPINAPLDWQLVLTDAEVRTLAGWALRLANGLGQEIQLMGLARIGGRAGPDACLPWHYTVEKIQPYNKSLLVRPGWPGIETIRDRDELRQLKEKAGHKLIRGYQISPAQDLLRDESFLVEIAKYAAEERKPIYFEGSVLGHAYYVMTKAGASIIPIIDEPAHHVKVYHKLVRDLIPVIIRQAGGLARIRTVPRAEAHSLLLQKLIEEAFEASLAAPSALPEELADVLDVVEALRSNSQIDNASLSAVRKKKRERRGGFDRLVYLEETDIRPLKVPSNRQGHLPLFGDEPVILAKKHSSIKSELLRIERSNSSGELARLSLSLVPPVPGNEKSMLVVDLDGVVFEGGRVALQFETTYGGARVTLRISRATENSAASSGQLPLPFAASFENRR
jgi:predicted house-cleaning noncanonical NTP pyrophosphatase (MazG superfamily)